MALGCVHTWPRDSSSESPKQLAPFPFPKHAFLHRKQSALFHVGRWREGYRTELSFRLTALGHGTPEQGTHSEMPAHHTLPPFCQAKLDSSLLRPRSQRLGCGLVTPLSSCVTTGRKTAVPQFPSL